MTEDMISLFPNYEYPHRNHAEAQNHRFHHTVRLRLLFLSIADSGA